MELIPNVTGPSHEGVVKDLLLKDVLASHQLVGEVTAHQGNDG